MKQRPQLTHLPAALAITGLSHRASAAAVILAVGALVSLTSTGKAATTFTGIGDFNDAENWDDGLPRYAAGAAVIEGTATMSGDYFMTNNSAPAVTDIIVNGGTLNTGNNELRLRSGATNPFRNAGIYVNGGGAVNVSSGGKLDVRGVNTYLHVGTSTTIDGVALTGAGHVVFQSGSIYGLTKGFKLINGTLEFETGVLKDISMGSGSAVHVGSQGILKFSELEGGNSFRINLDTTDFQIANGSTLALDFSNGLMGESYTLFSWSSITTPGNAYGEFSNVQVTGLGAGLSVKLDHGANSITATIIPEPSSIMLLLSGGFFLCLRKRR